MKLKYMEIGDKMGKGTLNIETEEAYRVVIDPYRVRIMKAFDTYGRAATVKEIADVLGDSAAKVSYHFKKMQAIGMFELEHEELINGIKAKYYRLKYDDINIQGYKSDIEDGDKISEYLNLLYGIVDDFKKDIKDMLQTAKEKSITGGCTMTSQDIYLTEAEHKAFIEEYNAFIEKYAEKREDTNRYAVLVASVQKFK